MSLTQENRPLAVITPLGEDALLLKSFNFHEQLSQLFSLELELLSTEEDLIFEDILGQNVTVRVDLASHEQRFINGHVTQFSQVGVSKGFAVYRANVSPWMWFLTRTADCRIFQNMTVPSIIAEVFDGHGYSDHENKLSGQYRTWEYCVQYRETDFNFVSRLMEQEGIYYFFEHENGKHKLVLCDDYSAHEQIPIVDYPQMDSNTIPYFPPDDTVTREGEYVSGWSINKSIQPGAYALNDYNFKKPFADISATEYNPHDHEADGFEIFDYPGEYTDADEAMDYSQIRLQELQTSYERIQGFSDVRTLSAGGLFDLSNFNREDQNKEYLILSVNHSAQQDLFASGSSGSQATYSNSFTVMDGLRDFRPSRTTPKPVVQGLQTAFVVGPKGDEIHTDEYGRVKCQFHWDRRSTADENSSCFIRVSQAWAGNQWGTMYLPRIGQEVIVEFLEGDPDKPLITGQVYNEDNKPPYDLPAKQNVSGIKSRSTKGGGGFNEITWDDTKDKEQLFIPAQRQHDQRTNADHLSWVGKSQHHRVEGSYFDDIYGDRNHTVGGELNFFVKDTLSVQADGDIHEKVSSNYALDAGREVHIKAGSKIVLEAGSQISLKVGGNFIDIGMAGISIKGTMVNINSGGSAGSGSGSQPEKAKLPKEADNREPPKDMKDIKKRTLDEKPLTVNPTAFTLIQAAKNGTPFCEVCEEETNEEKKAKHDAEQQRAKEEQRGY